MRRLRGFFCGILSFVLLVPAAVNGVAAQEPESVLLVPKDVLYGDVNADGYVTIDDATELQRHLSGYAPMGFQDIPKKWIKDISDVDQSGVTDISDVTEIQRFVAEDADSRVGEVAYTWQKRLLLLSDSLPMDDMALYFAQNSNATYYLEDSEYSPDDYSFSTVEEYCYGVNLDKPDSYRITVPANAAKIFILDYDTEQGWEDIVSGGSYRIQNIIPNHLYVYLVTDENHLLLRSGQCMTEDALRMLDAGGNTFNIRDIGGWKCDGGTLKYDLLLRGCELDGCNYHITLSEAQKKLFTDVFHVADDIDLRNDSQVAGEDGIYGTSDDIVSSALGPSVSYVRYPIASYAAGINLDARVQTGYYASLIKRITQDAAAGKTSYVHCMAGADRTGTICAVIEALCGVSLNDIERDYELTSFAAGHTRKRTGTSWRELMERINSMPGSTFRDKTVSYALQAGVTIDEINTLRESLIDGDPAPLSP